MVVSRKDSSIGNVKYNHLISDNKWLRILVFLSLSQFLFYTCEVEDCVDCRKYSLEIKEMNRS